MSVTVLLMILALISAGISMLSIPTGRYNALGGAVFLWILSILIGDGAIH